MRVQWLWLCVFLVIGTASFFFYQQSQPALSYEFASQFDGNDYTNSYQYLNGILNDYEVAFPFNGRILVPWLAAQVHSGDIITDFQFVNFLFTLASIIVLFLLWRQLGFDLKWFITGFFWLFFHWTGMIRLNAFDPITVDLPIYLFQGLFLLIILKRKFIWLLILAPLAIAQKESFLALIILLTVYGFWHNRKTKEGYYPMGLIIIALVLSLATKFLINYYFPPIEAGKGALITLAYHAKQVFQDPFEIIRWLVAMFMAFGPILFLAFRKYAQSYRFDNTRNVLLLFSLTYLAFGILAGGDMTRIIFLGFPFIATWVIFELQEITTKQLLLIGLLSLPLMTLYKVIPDPAFEWELWKSWYPEFTSGKTVLMFGFYGIVSWGILIFKPRSTNG
jgi:hypothetical protein